MRKIQMSAKTKIIALLVLVILFSWLYLTFQTYGNWEFALNLRGKKVIAYFLVGISLTFATISFQTLTQNHFLTPNILGFDSLYVLIQTLLFFFLGQNFQYHGLLFALNVSLMVGLSTILFSWLLTKGKHNLYLLLMVGMILGTLFRSASTFFQVLMDPNEYDKLQGKLFASFGKIDVSLLILAGSLMILIVSYLWSAAYRLDVLHLGRDKAENLGINVSTFQLSLLICISFLIALATSLVGPVTFLGFIVANVTYQLMGTFRHRTLFLAGSLISVLLLVAGQFMVEHIFKGQTTLSVVIEFVGGIYFIGKILAERKSKG